MAASNQERARSRLCIHTPQIHVLIGFTVLAMVIAVVSLLVLRGSFSHGIVAGVAVIYLAAPTLVLGLLAFIVMRQWKPRVAIWTLVITAGLLLVAAAPVVAYPFGYLLSTRDIRQAKIYCEKLAVHVDAAKAATGHYPDSIGQLAAKVGQVPYLLRREKRFYHSDGTAFTFSFIDPRGMFNGFVFESKTREWYRWD